MRPVVRVRLDREVIDALNERVAAGEFGTLSDAIRSGATLLLQEQQVRLPAPSNRGDGGIAAVLTRALEDALECERHPSDFEAWKGSGMRLPARQPDGSALAFDVVVHEVHVDEGISRACGSDTRTVTKWRHVLARRGFVRTLHQRYVLLSLYAPGFVDDRLRTAAGNRTRAKLDAKAAELELARLDGAKALTGSTDTIAPRLER